MHWVKALFAENSSVSMMRFMALTSLVVASYLAIVGKNDCVTIFVTAAFGGKVAQKHLELRNGTKVSETDSEDKGPQS